MSDFLILDEARAFSQEDAAGENTAGDALGTYLTVGDFNDDGFDDVAAGAPHKDDDSGVVAAFFGSEAGASNGRLVRQSDLGEVSEEGDLFGTSLVSGDFNRDGVEDLAIGAPGEAVGDGPRSGAVFVFTTLQTGFLLTQADADVVSEEGDQFGASVATGDINGDTFQELIVGAPGKGGSGAIFVFFGAPTGLVIPGIMITQTLAGEVDEAGDLFGLEVSTGAYNGDGFGEIVVGAPGEAPGDDPRSGAVFVFPGSFTGVQPGFMLTQADAGEVNEEGDRFGAAIGSGDVDSDFDAIEELAIGAPGKAPGDGPRSGAVFIFPGQVDVGLTTGFMLTQEDAGGVNEEGDEFGAAINFGVLDIDRFEETVIGAPSKSINGVPEAGAVFIYPGDADGIQPGFMITQEDAGGVHQPGDRFGAYFAIEDFNDNNGAETVIGAPGDSPDLGPNSGSIFIFPGFPLTPPMVTQIRAGGTNQGGDEFGAAQVAGDFDNDGFEDLAVGSPGEGGAGTVSIFRGSRAGNTGISFGFGITQLDAGGAAEFADRFGESLAAGDFNGDDFADLAVGTPGKNRDAGAVYVFLGSKDGLTSGQRIDQTNAGEGRRPGDAFGEVLIVGDFNGDGFDELVVGAPGTDDMAGAVFVFAGSDDGIASGASLLWRGPDFVRPRDRYGQSLAASDLNADGFDELAVGAPGRDGGAGIVYLFRGSANGFTTQIDVTSQTDPATGQVVVTRQVITTGRVIKQSATERCQRVHLGSGRFREQCTTGVRAPGNAFGAALVDGDFDGDEFADLAVGAPGADAGTGSVALFPGSPLSIATNDLLQPLTVESVRGRRLVFADGNADFAEPGMSVVNEAGDVVAQIERVGAGRFFLNRLVTLNDFPDPNGDRERLFRVTLTGRTITLEDAGEDFLSGDHFGATLASGDFADDGFDELVVGVPGRAENSGAIAVFPGSERGATIALMLTQSGNGGADEPGDRFGLGVATGDFDGDGEDDLTIGGPGEAPGAEPRGGAIFLIHDFEIMAQIRLGIHFDRECLESEPEPLEAGENRLIYLCGTPGSVIAFAQGIEAGSFHFQQLNTTVDIAQPTIVALAVSDASGMAVAPIELTSEEIAEGRVFQAFQMFADPALPRLLRVSNVLETEIPAAPLLAEAQGPGGTALNPAMLPALVEAAKARWRSIGLTSQDQAMLERVQVAISELPDGYLGSTQSGTVLLDRDAAGHGWFVDATPDNDTEFTVVSSGHWQGIGAAAQGVDALTVVMHELGHHLGFPDLVHARHVMHGQSDVGVRRTWVSDTNLRRPADVNADGEVGPIDVLLVMNALNQRDAVGRSDVAEEQPAYLDTTADFVRSPADALLVINYLNRDRQGLSTGEGEAAIEAHFTQLGSGHQQPLAHTDSSLPATGAVRSAEYSRSESTKWPAERSPANPTPDSRLRARAADETGASRFADLEPLLDTIAADLHRSWYDQ